MKVGVVAVSVREQRLGESISQWAFDFTKNSQVFDEVKFLDLKEFALPVFNEPNHPLQQNYQYDYTKKWGQAIEELDAIVFVTPEYNYFAPAPLVNAIDYLAKEWNYKPAAFIGYGGVSGGLRAIQAAKPLVTTVKMMPIPESVSIHMAWSYLDDEGKLKVGEEHKESTRSMLKELRRWADALKTLR